MVGPRARLWALYLGAFVLLTLFFSLVSENPDVRIAHGVLAYLVLIIGASRQAGQGLSFVTVVLSYLAVDYFFVPPRRQFGDASTLNWLILFGFLIVGFLISQLFAQLQRAVTFAGERTAEVERLSAERLQLEREVSTVRVLQEADRLKNALLLSIAHDLRSPVATLALVADPAAGFPADDALRRVADESRRLSEFLTALQRFASSDAGGVMQRSAHPVLDLIDTAVRSSASLYVGRQLVLPTDTHDWHALCDFTLTVHVLGNLLQNASRYAPVSEPVVISLEGADDAAELTIVVSDRGPGIADADLDQLFTPLRRTAAEAALTEAGGPVADVPMGMGLSIARTVARAQRGDVSYCPRAGGGSEFRLRLPRADRPAPTPTGARSTT
jgi:two-component system sensor histidine kinase KdpD